jgi:hypothetical protein
MGFVDAGDELLGQLRSGLDAFGAMIMAESLIQCPVDTGTLKRSFRIGDVSGWDFAFKKGGGFQRAVRGKNGQFAGAIEAAPGGDMSLTLGYGYGDEVNPKTNHLASEYAAPVHEIIEAYHEPPTKAKFLEDPVYEHASLMEPVLAAYMRGIIKPEYRIEAIIEGIAKDNGAHA